MYTRARARLHGHEYDAHAQFRRNKRELSRRREKHQKTRRAQSDGAARARDGTQGEEEDARIEGESEIGRQKKRDAAGIKGEADKERLCEKPKEGERGRDINAVGEKRERKTTTREGRGDGGAGDVCTLKYYSQMKYRAGPAGTQRARIFLDLI